MWYDSAMHLRLHMNAHAHPKQISINTTVTTQLRYVHLKLFICPRSFSMHCVHIESNLSIPFTFKWKKSKLHTSKVHTIHDNKEDWPQSMHTAQVFDKYTTHTHPNTNWMEFILSPHPYFLQLLPKAITTFTARNRNSAFNDSNDSQLVAFHKNWIQKFYATEEFAQI